MMRDTSFAPVQASRESLLAEFDPDEDVTLIRSVGNVGDELILEGTRELLRDRLHREVALDDLARSSGRVGLLIGGGAWSRTYNAFMPEALALAEARFERVVVLPSSFDTSVDRVREALRTTRATVYAREPASYARIQGLCRARMAHDAAFFADLSDHAALPARGTLLAYRTDAEAPHDAATPTGNDDISVTAEELDSWLRRIAAHAVIRTDRAHVAIAAARMGRRVEWSPERTGKLEQIAAHCLAHLDVHRVERPRRPPAALRDGDGVASAAAPLGDPPRVTAVILTRDRPAQVVHAVASVLCAAVPQRVVVIDNGSDETGRDAARALAGPRVEVRLQDRNLGCAGGRRLGVELSETEYVLFLDDDAQLRPGALEALVDDLDANPDAAAATAMVVYDDGRLYHFGGAMEVGHDTVRFGLHGYGLRPEDPSIAATGPCGWTPGTAALVRRRLLERVPIDDGMSAYYEDNDWCVRVAFAHPGAFRRVREAVAVHASPTPTAPTQWFASRAPWMRRLEAKARFLRRHGRVLDVDLAGIMPELALPDGRLDVARARLLLELVHGCGSTTVLQWWCNGSLLPLLLDAPTLHDRTLQLDADVGGLRHVLAERDAALTDAESRLAQLDAELLAQQTELARLRERDRTLQAILDGGWWALRGRLAPAARVVSRVRRRRR